MSVKNLFNKVKSARVAIMAVVFTLAMSMAAFAESGTANTAVVSAMTTLANDMKATASSLIPIALGVVGLTMVVVFGIRIFKRIAGRG